MLGVAAVMNVPPVGKYIPASLVSFFLFLFSPNLVSSLESGGMYDHHDRRLCDKAITEIINITPPTPPHIMSIPPLLIETSLDRKQGES